MSSRPFSPKRIVVAVLAAAAGAGASIAVAAAPAPVVGDVRQPDFPTTSNEVPGAAGDIEAADFDRDGARDLIVALPSWSQFGTSAPAVGVLMGTPGSRAVRPRNAGEVVPAGANDVAVGDVDRDGDVDAVTASNDTPGRMGVLINDGTSRFADGDPDGLLAVPSRATSVALGDIDRDGDLDAVLATPGLTTLSRFDGAGTTSGFDAARQDLDVGPDVTDAQLADVNGDGWLDLVLVRSSGGMTAEVRLNDRGTISPLPSLQVAGDVPERLRAVDADQDGDLDLVAAMFNGGVDLLRNDGDALVRVHLSDVSGTAGAVLTDLNRDGRLDVAATDIGGDLVVSQQLASGAFGPPDRLALRAPRDVLAGDQDGDGRPDLAVGTGDPSAPVALVGNLTPVAAPNAFSSPADQQAASVLHDVKRADLDGDGRPETVGGARDGFVIVRRGTAPEAVDIGGSPLDVAVADVNRDGRPDLLGILADRVVIAYAQAGGGFTVDSVPAGSALQALDVGDLDRDGDLDLAVLDRGAEAGILQLLNDGTGRFPAPPVLVVSTTSATSDLAIADLDRDARPDFVTLDGPGAGFPGGWTWHRNNGDGGWNSLAPQPNTIPAEPFGRLTVGDVDGDGWPDVAFAAARHQEQIGDDPPRDFGGVELWRRPGLGGGRELVLARDVAVTGIDFGDVTRDGRGDVAITGTSLDSSDAPEVLQVLRDTGAGYQLWRETRLGVRATGGVVLDDPDRDGFLDALVPAVDVLRVVRTLEDTAAPVVTFTPAPPRLTRSRTVPWAFTVTDDTPLTVGCQLDGNDVDCTGGSFTGTNLADGGHILEVTATDGTGQKTVARNSVTVDATAPVVDVSGMPTLVRTRSPSLPFTVDDATANVTCAVGSGPARPCSSPFVPAALDPDGSYDIVVTATDAAGNVASQRQTVVVDTVGPVVTLDTAPSGRRNASTERVTFTVAADAVTFDCALDGAPVTPCEASGTDVPVGTGDGPRTFTVRATDAAGNVGSAGVSWVVDRTAPGAPAAGGGPAALTNATTAKFSLSGDADTSGLRCVVDGEDAAACGPNLVLNGLADGAHELRVTAVDAAGNASAETVRRWTVDTTPPVVTLTDPPTGRRRAATETIAFTAPGAASTQCVLVGTGVVPCTDVALGADGAKEVRAEARDAAGNVGTATASWVLDRVAPVPAVTGGPTGATNDPDATFTLGATDDDPTVSLTCRVGSTGAFEPCGATKTLRGLRDGTYTLTLRATDGAGNTGADATRTWTVDTVAPVVRIASGPSGPQSSREAQFSVEGDPGVTFACTVNGTSVPCTAPLRDLADGTYRFAVVATDPAGNRSAPATQAFVVDTAAPKADVAETPPPEVQSGGDSTFRFGSADPDAKFTCALDGGPFAPCTSPATFAKLPAGEHRFSVQAVDPAGNASPATETRWRVAAPVAAQQAPPDPPGQEDPPPATQDPQPVFQQTVEVRASGKACVTPPGGKQCRPLGPDELIPIGSVIDTTAKGSFVDLTTAGPDGTLQTARFYEGIFKIGQVRAPDGGQLTELTLVGELVCPPAKRKNGKASAAASRAKKKTRRLWGDGKGRFRTRGRYGAATVRGTKWLVEDLCEGTKITVARGVVDGTDLVRNTTRQVKAGQNVLIRPR